MRCKSYMRILYKHEIQKTYFKTFWKAFGEKKEGKLVGERLSQFPLLWGNSCTTDVPFLVPE